MSVLRETFRLNTAFLIPKIALGTFQLPGNKATTAIKAALDTGYRHFDTAALYRNERVVGEALKQVDRSELFVASKVDPMNHGYAKARSLCLQSMEALDVEYLDLMLLLWPGVSNVSNEDPTKVTARHDTWKALEELHNEGKIKNIGVSNFLQDHFEKLYDICTIPPSVNQIEFHPLCHDKELLQYCQDRKVIVEAYSPLAKANKELWGNADLNSICEKHNRTTAQVLLRWGYQKDVVLVTKSAQPERIESNIKIDFTLDREDMNKLDNLHTGKRMYWNPPGAK